MGKVSETSFQEAFAAMLRAETVYHIVVIEDLHESRIVATGTLIVEQKFLRGCGKVIFFFSSRITSEDNHLEFLSRFEMEN